MRAEDEYATFVAGRWSSLWRLAYLLAGSRAEAEAVLDQALVETYLHWHGVEDAESQVRREIVGALLTGHPRRRSSADDAAPAPLALVEPDEGLLRLDGVTLWPLMCALPPRQRAVLVLRVYENLSAQGAADALGCTTGEVRAQSLEAFTALRRAVLAVTGEPDST
jgi:DNA-directed RNA polymerase specialized sigma24 family protein